MTLQELRQAAIYCAIVGVLLTLVVLGDTLTPASADSNATPTPTAVVFVQVPADFPTGVFVDHLGESVQIQAARITYYEKYMDGSVWFDTNGKSYYLTPSGRLFRVED